jgi:hypothetical protein
MSSNHKPTKRMRPRKESASLGGPLSKKPARGEYELIETKQLQKADEILARIERRGEELAVSADRLLKRVS